ncbi:hypothetical protein ACFYXM_29380 [Streptomyces sp. NPDC002476]|uniref:hypothetical protein n=1 Tax=Streptomyces sp. NPDC002476 TaxID=3364648 RepID=UPI00368C4FFD
MKDLVRRFTELLVRPVWLVRPARLVRPVRPVPAVVQPYACAYVVGPTVRRTGERAVRGEDSPLVRPYVIAHERQLAEARRRRRTLWVAVRGAGSGVRYVRRAAGVVA